MPSLLEILQAFFIWLKNQNCKNYKVDPKNGQMVLRTEKDVGLIYIMDPFNFNGNTARAINIDGKKQLDCLLRQTIEAVENNNLESFRSIMKLTEPDKTRNDEANEYINKNITKGIAELLNLRPHINERVSKIPNINERITLLRENSTPEDEEIQNK
uniref:Uncharacterized protein n=1 Tax=Meloidogyne hapla TaxID=6305 RepID=A0A1I8BDW2_MELHA